MGYSVVGKAEYFFFFSKSIIKPRHVQSWGVFYVNSHSMDREM
jgi:hypothetical protein